MVRLDSVYLPSSHYAEPRAPYRKKIDSYFLTSQVYEAASPTGRMVGTQGSAEEKIFSDGSQENTLLL